MMRVEVTMYNQGEMAAILGVERETFARWKANRELMLPVCYDSRGDGTADQYYAPAVIEWYMRLRITQARGWGRGR
jgi:hypothetical protein